MAKNDKKKRKTRRNKTKTSGIEHNPIDKEVSDVNENVDDDIEPESNKRPLPADDSDNDEQPKRKKKKKPPVASGSGESKGNKSIRQMKREKHAQRIAEKEAASKDQLKGQCISYLSEWKHNRNNWKFMKVKQLWLYKNKFSAYLLPDSSWPVFLEYFESAKGNIRNLLLEDSNKVIKEMDEWTESQSKSNTGEGEQEKEDGPKKPDDTAYKRARDLIQCLQE